ncbi:hypothetical protein NC651_004732 [Populus alba x Populus x berolinensis]|nr:hypothetical protein NC651_004732 [Populus alba x Populus x berolinensis]
MERPTQNLPTSEVRCVRIRESQRWPRTPSMIESLVLDPVCPDSRDTMPPRQKALKHYGSQCFARRITLLPLPSLPRQRICSSTALMPLFATMLKLFDYFPSVGAVHQASGLPGAGSALDYKVLEKSLSIRLFGAK